MKSFSRFSLIAFLCLLLFACTSKPDCTLQETAGGGLVPYGDCSNCDAFAIINADGAQRPMTPVDAERYVNHNPPSASYNPSSPSLSDCMLMHYMLSGPRAAHYQTVYAPQYNSYNTYRRAHPGYVAPRRYVNRTTVINKTVINRVVRTSPGRSTLGQRYSTAGTGPGRVPLSQRPQFQRSSITTTTTTTSRPRTSWGSSFSPGRSVTRTSSSSRSSWGSSSPSRSSSSSSRSSFSSSSRRR